MASAEKPLTYEEERQRIIEENKRRMKAGYIAELLDFLFWNNEFYILTDESMNRLQELGLMETVESFQKQPMLRKAPIRRVSAHIEFAIETRRSSRAASRPKVDYKEASMDIGLRRTRGVGRPLLRRGYVSPAAKNEAAVRAGDIKTSHPSFVKAMLKSHTSGGFWLGLPSDFCSMNFTKDDIIVLEDEKGLEWECVYLHNKHGLSGGWRGFSLDHDLEDGDAVVFELVTSSRFKVFITRAAGSEEVSAQKVAAVAKKRDYQHVVKDSKNVHVHSVLHKSLRREKRDQFDVQSKEVQSDDDIQLPTNLKEKILQVTKRPGKSKQQLTAKTESKPRQITPFRKERLKASMKVFKKDTFVRRAERKTDMQDVRKEIAGRQIEQKSNLPPGTRLKPVGVCSIARGSTKRKLPAIFPSRKYSFFSGPKSVKVH